MGKPQSTGNLVNALAQDSSNNIGIGGAANASFKLQVTGTSNFTSTINGAGVSLSDTLNGTTANFTSSVTGNFFIASPVATSAQSGGLRLGSQVAINARNAANSADITLITTNSSDGVAIRNGALNINSSGNVGIGTSSPSVLLNVVNSDNSTNSFVAFAAQNLTQQVEIWYGGIRMGGTAAAADLNLASKGSSGNMLFSTNSTERMRITSGGTVQIGTASTNNIAITGGISGNTPGILLNSGTSANGVGDSGNIQIFDRTNSRSWVIQMDASYQLRTFYYNGSSWATNGYQTTGGTWTNSDERRKENITLLQYGLNEVLQLNPKKFTYKIDEFKKPYMGFIAQEVLPIIPEAVQSYLESTNEEEIEYYAMNYDNLVPVLVKAIQELSAKVSALENKS